MKKNIIIIGTGRVGKTTLAKKLSDELNYSVIGTDDLITAFMRSLPQLGISSSHDTGAGIANFTPFLAHLIGSMAYRSNCHNGASYVFEGSGSHFDFDKMLPILDMYDEWKDNHLLIGLIYPEIAPNDLFDHIREYDVESDWTYNLRDDELKKHVIDGIEYSRNFHEKFQKYNPIVYDVSKNREKILDEIVKNIRDDI